MADKTTTLKTKTGDNVYPNVIGDNRDNAIVNSAHINHTLTKDHKINFRLDTNVSGLIFNSLQKPAGLTKTKLVGVGTNGQENIEIGDNLTLANGKLSASGGGGGGTTLYRHFITLEKSDLKFTFNYFNNTDSVITYSKIFQVLENSPMSGNGYFKDSNGPTLLYSVEKNGSMLICKGIKLDNRGTSLNIDGFTISDKVSPVI